MKSVLIPTKPLIKTKYGNRPLFTINKDPNRLYGMLPPNKTLKTCVMSFVTESHAYMIANMLEEHKRRTSEWPESGTTMVLPTNENKKELEELVVIKWDPDNLKTTCANNILDLITLTKVTKTRQGLTVSGETFHFDASFDFYKVRFDEIYQLTSPVSE